MGILSPQLGLLRACMNHHSNVALVFGLLENRKGPALVCYVASSSEGPRAELLAEDLFGREFHRDFDKPLGSVALSFLKATQSAYLPGGGVVKLLMEIYIMATTQNTSDHLKDLPMVELVKHYNSMATAAGKAVVKEFKSKATALNRIQILMDEADKGTDKQQLTRKQKAAALHAGDPKPKASAKVAAKKAPKAAAVPAKKSGKAAPKGDKREAAGERRGQGIGAFCMDLIVKGKSNEEVLKAVKSEFPDAATSPASIAWYRNKLKSEGKL